MVRRIGGARGQTKSNRNTEFGVQDCDIARGALQPLHDATNAHPKQRAQTWVM
jgi:hypothetical protein